MSTDTTAPAQSDIDAILDLAAPVTDAPEASDSGSDTSTPSDTSAAQNGTENPSPANPTSAPANEALYPNVFKIYQVGSTDENIEAAPENGDNPEGTMTVAEFAGYLTVEAFKAASLKNEAITPELIVKDPNVYTALKAKRHALPVVLVYPEGVEPTVENQREAKFFLPVAEATETFKNRPTRGEGNGSSSGTKRTYDEIITSAAKKLLELKGIQARLDRATEQKEKAEGILAKNAKWLRPLVNENQPFTSVTNDDGSVTETPAEPLQDADLDAKVIELFAEKAAELEEAAALEADAAKQSDIPDAAPSDSSTTNE